MIKLIKADPKANRVSRLRLNFSPKDNKKTSAQDVDLTSTMEMKDVQQAMWNVTFAIKQDTSAICATNVINSNKYL